MAAPTQYYVDPSIAGDSGAGSVGSPYGDLEYCLEQITRDSTNGDQINIKAGTAEILEFALDIEGDYGTPTAIAPITFRGYTTAANDGGIGAITGGGSVSIFTHSTASFTHFVDLHLTNTGSASILGLNDGCLVANCELDTSSGIAIDVDGLGKVVNCYIHDCTGTYAIFLSSTGGIVYGNLIASGVTVSGISVASSIFIGNNVVKLTTTNGADGIRWSDDSQIINNSVFATAGTGAGFVGSGAGRDKMVILNNIAEGFSGTGGVGYDFSATDHTLLWGHNAAFNNTTDENKSTGEILVDIGGDDIPLAASAFADPSSLDFSVGTEVKATAMPNFVGGATTPGTTQFLDMGAAQREEAGGGGGPPAIIGG